MEGSLVLLGLRDETAERWLEAVVLEKTASRGDAAREHAFTSWRVKYCCSVMSRRNG